MFIQISFVSRCRREKSISLRYQKITKSTKKHVKEWYRKLYSMSKDFFECYNSLYIAEVKENTKNLQINKVL